MANGTLKKTLKFLNPNGYLLSWFVILASYRQTDRQTDRHTDRQTDTQIDTLVSRPQRILTEFISYVNIYPAFLTFPKRNTKLSVSKLAIPLWVF